MRKEIILCDNCNKTIKELPYKIAMACPSESDDKLLLSIGDKNKQIDIANELEFCSEKCFISYFKKIFESIKDRL